MTPLQRIRRRRPEQTSDHPSDVAAPEPADDLTFVARPSDGGDTADIAVVAPDAPALEAAADADAPAAPETGEADRTPGALRRFGRWASTGTADAVVQPEPEPRPEPPAQSKPKGPSARDRGRLRRRLRYLRRARELGFRDLGGLVFDQYRFRQSSPELLAGKLNALHVVDSELRALEHILGEGQEFTDLREPGISVCPFCATLHSSDARYCEMCGRPQTGTDPSSSEA